MDKIKNFINKNTKKPQQLSGYPEGSKNPQHFVDYNYSSGLNVDAAPEHMSDEELRKADDLVVTQNGGIAKRLDSTTYYSSSFDSIEQLIKWPRKDGTKQLLAVVLDGAQYKIYDITNTSEIQDIESSSVGYFIFKDEIYFMDGNSYYKYDGTDVETPAADADDYIALNNQNGNFETGDTIQSFRIHASTHTFDYTKGETISAGGSFTGTGIFMGVGAYDNSIYLRDISGDWVKVNENEDFTSIHDTYVDLNNPAGTSIHNLLVTNTANDVEYVAGPDYQYDPSDGRIKVLSTGDMADDTEYHVSYEYHPPDITGDDSETTIDIYTANVAHQATIVSTLQDSGKNYYGISYKNITDYKGDTYSPNDTLFAEEDWVHCLADSQIYAEISEVTSLSTSVDELKKSNIAVKHTNSYRFFFAGNPNDKSALYYSEPNQPGIVKGTSVLYPTEAEGPITGLTEMMGYLVVSYKNGDWVYTGVDPANDAQWKKIPSRHGAYNNNVITLTENSLTTFSDYGIYVKNPSILGMDDNMVPGEKFIVNIAKNKVEGVLKDITDPGESVSVYDPDDDYYYLAFCDDSSGTNNKILVYNWHMQGFTLWTGFSINDFCYYDSDVLLAAEGSNVIQLNTTDYTGTYTLMTKPYSFQAPFYNKEVDKVYIALENPQEADYSVDVTLIVDNVVKRTKTISVDPGPSTFLASITVRETGSRFQLKVEG